MRLRFYAFFLGIFLLGAQSLKAQAVRRFNTEPAQFIIELQDRYKAVQDKAVKADFEKFTQNWTNGLYSPEQQRYLINMSNKMLDQGLILVPYFHLFYKGYTGSLERSMNPEILEQWKKIATELVETTDKEFLDFLTVTSNLFEKNVLYQSSETRKWYVDSADFKLSNKGGRLAIEFPNVKLKGVAVNDTIEIQTSGVFFGSEGIWKGAKGVANFNRIMPGENAQVSFKEFSIEFRKSSYKVDTVWLQFPRFFAKPIAGSFADELIDFFDTAQRKRAKFPRFTSFDNDLKIKGIVGDKSVFTGGFSLQGTAINTSTVDGKPSVIDVYFKDKPKVTLQSKGFRIQNGVATSLKTEFTLNLDSGKYIYHPSANVSFKYANNLLEINKGEDGLMRGSFADNFHNMSIDVQTVRWKITEPFVDFDNYNNDKPALFQSNDFYRQIYYDRIQGPLTANPLEKIYAYYNRMPKDKQLDDMKAALKKLYLAKNRDAAAIANLSKQITERTQMLKRKYVTPDRLTFSLKDYCAFYGSDPGSAQHPFIDLHDDGFVVYNFETDSVTVKDKLFNYILMNKKSKDYDVIRLSSVIAAKPNATLNLLSNELDIEGVAAFNFSDSQSVYVLPNEQKVKAKKNRTLEFGGQVSAGRFEFFGQAFKFDYTRFTVDFAVIDSMRMYFPDESGVRLRPIKSVFRNIGGTLFIDKPNNKSGNIDYPEYPIFKSNRGGDILYDKPSIHGGQYIADKFKFTVDPFTIDSLDNFTIDGLKFDGTFYSADIFPVFRHYVYIQPDYSLGFVKRTPPAGLSMYKGKGKGEMTMNLSEVGFYGETGTIDYETSKTAFTRILMLPTTTTGPINTYDLKENTRYAEAHAVDATLNWFPYKDEYKVTTGKYATKAFVYAHKFTGTTTQSPSKLMGDGLLKWDLAELRSNAMHLAPKQAISQQADLKIFTLDSSKVAFASNNINGTMDFLTRTGSFRSNIPGQITQFPFNMYQTNLSDYVWKMDAKTIEARVGSTMAGITPDFMSTHIRQDSLRFEGRKGLYDMNDYTLKVSEIPHIDLGDSRLFLADGKVLIRAEANMDTVIKAKIIANRIDQYHTINDVKAKIYGKNGIAGAGWYKYVDKLGKKQDIYFDSMYFNREHHLEAYGNIKEERSFTLDTRIAFKGSANLHSQEQFLRFSGLVKPMHTFKNMIESHWCKFKGSINPQDVVLPMSPPRNQSGARIFVGLHVAKDSSHIYPVFNSTKRRLSDNDVTQDTGILYWDHEKQSFMAGSESKLREGSRRGNYVQFNEKDHSIHAEGPMDFGVESEYVKFRTAGEANLKPGDSSFVFNLSMLLDFPLHPDFKKRLGEIFVGEGDGAANINTDVFKDALAEMIDDPKLFKSVLEDVEKNNRIKGNLQLLGGKDETNYNLILSEAEFRWDSKLNGMFCDGQVTLVSMFGLPINRSVTATMYLEAKRGSQKMHIYLSDGANTIYFFLTPNKVSIYSNDDELNKIMEATNSKVKPSDFGVMITGERSVDRFLRKLGLE